MWLSNCRGSSTRVRAALRPPSKALWDVPAPRPSQLPCLGQMHDEDPPSPTRHPLAPLSASSFTLPHPHPAHKTCTSIVVPPHSPPPHTGLPLGTLAPSLAPTHLPIPIHPPTQPLTHPPTLTDPSTPAPTMCATSTDSASSRPAQPSSRWYGSGCSMRARRISCRRQGVGAWERECVCVYVCERAVACARGRTPPAALPRAYPWPCPFQLRAQALVGAVA